MTATVVTIPHGEEEHESRGHQEAMPEARVHVKVQVDAIILAANAAMHLAREWLAAHVGERLGVATPELVVDDNLVWRFDVTFTRPNAAQPGSGALYQLGHIRLDATDGSVIDSEALAAELRVHITSLAP